MTLAIICFSGPSISYTLLTTNINIIFLMYFLLESIQTYYTDAMVFMVLIYYRTLMMYLSLQLFTLRFEEGQDLDCLILDIFHTNLITMFTLSGMYKQVYKSYIYQDQEVTIYFFLYIIILYMVSMYIPSMHEVFRVDSQY